MVMVCSIPDRSFFDRNQAAVARENARRTQLSAEYDTSLLEARADVVRTAEERGIVREQLAAARDGSQAATRLAELARTAAVSGALSPLLAADIFERSFASRLGVHEIEQTAAEIEVALAIASGSQP